MRIAELFWQLSLLDKIENKLPKLALLERTRGNAAHDILDIMLNDEVLAKVVTETQRQNRLLKKHIRRTILTLTLASNPASFAKRAKKLAEVMNSIEEATL